MADIPRKSFTAGIQYRLNLKDGSKKTAMCVGAEDVHFETDDGEVISLDMLNAENPGEPIGDRASGSSGPGRA
ncbi:MAG: hypothetical protein ACOC2N_01055 [Spirochaetota bacterium]